MLGTVAMRRGAGRKKRFSPLMMEEGAYYFEDYVADLRQGAPVSSTAAAEGGAAAAGRAQFAPKSQATRGRLHICSKSLVFEPDDSRRCILRMPLRQVLSVKQIVVQGTECVHVSCTRIVEIGGGAIGPYRFRDLRSERENADQADGECVFSLMYVDPSKLMQLLLPLLSVEQQQNAVSHDHAAAVTFGQLGNGMLDTIIREREAQYQFDSSRIVDLREVVLPIDANVRVVSTTVAAADRPIICTRISPLVRTRGLFVLTDHRVYFQPFHNEESAPVLSYRLADVVRIYRRRYAMLDVGIELYFPFDASGVITQQTDQQDSAYFVFENKALRDRVWELLWAQPLCAAVAQPPLSMLTHKWSCGEMCNYDYLMALNQQAGRSLQDLAAYPVFPWVLKDYTSRALDLSDKNVFRDLSKPMGALGEARLASFRRRMKEMPADMCNGQPFLYGTHYSTPAYVLYYLVRVAPEYLLRLQNGKFDNSDRLFLSIAETWMSCSEGSPTDVKELIPEFYSSSRFSERFLKNELDVDLGFTQRGDEVDDVHLPPWARNAADFVKTLGRALESDYVSANLHSWIDLIFGYKQRGQAAIDADNVFYYLTYEGVVDLDSIKDPLARASLQQQINEFGQTPKQLFTEPHPTRGGVIRDAALAKAIATITPVKKRMVEVNTGEKDPEIRSEIPLGGADGGGARASTEGKDGGGMKAVKEVYNDREKAAAKNEARSVGSAVMGMSSVDSDVAGPINGATTDLVGKAGVVLTSEPEQEHLMLDPSRDAAAVTATDMNLILNGDIAHSAVSELFELQREVSNSDVNAVETGLLDERDAYKGTPSALSLSDSVNLFDMATSADASRSALKGLGVEDILKTVEDEIAAAGAAPSSWSPVALSNEELTTRRPAGESSGAGLMQPASTIRAHLAESKVGGVPGTTIQPQTKCEATFDVSIGGRFEDGHTRSADAAVAENGKTSRMTSSTLEVSNSDNALAALIRSEASLKCHFSPVTALDVSFDGKQVYSVDSSSMVSVYSFAEEKQTRNSKVCQLTLSSVCLSPLDRHSATLAIGSWDNFVHFYSVDFGRVVGQLAAHDDAVSDLAVFSETMITSSWDATVKLWRISPGEPLPSEPLVEFMEHDSDVKCVSLCHAQVGNVAASGSSDGSLLVWDVRQQMCSQSLDRVCESDVTDIEFSTDGLSLFSCSKDGKFRCHDLRTGKVLIAVDVGEPLSTLCHTRSTNRLDSGDLVMMGGERGGVFSWHSGINRSLAASFPRSFGAVTSLRLAGAIASSHSSASSSGLSPSRQWRLFAGFASGSDALRVFNVPSALLH